MPRPPLDLPDLARQHRRLQRLVVALVGDHHGAEDVVQDAWLRVLEQGPREPQALGAWLRTATRRLASNLRRGRRRRSEREEQAARGEALPSSEEIAARLELEARVLSLLDELDEPDRTLLRDRYLGELTPAELARRDGLPPETVKARLARGRAKLRAKLERAGLSDDVHWTTALAPLLAPREAWHLVPAANAPAPTANAPAPTANAPAPTANAPAPTANAPVPTAGVPDAAASAPLPASSAPAPTSSAPAPTSSAPFSGANGPIHAPHAPLVTATTSTALPTALATATPPLALGVPSLAGLLVMKKIVLAAAVAAVGYFAWQSIEPSGGQPLARPALPGDAAPASTALAPLPTDVERAERPESIEATPTTARTLRSASDAASPSSWIVRGRARLARPSGPYAGLPLRLALFDGYSPHGEPWHEATVVSGADGTFALALDDPGRTVVLTVAAESDAERAVVTYGPYVAVDGEAPPGPIDVLVFPLDARLAGSVRDERGDAVRGCRITGMYGAADTDSDGRYAMRVAASAWGGVTATAPGFGEELRELEGLVPGGETTVDFVLRAGGKVEGTVRDERGTPLEGVRVANNGPSRNSVVTDRAGAYSIDWLRLVEGDWVHLTAEAEGYASVGHAFEILAETSRFAHDFVLQRGVTVSGRVVDPDGAPVRGAEVWLGADEHSWNSSSLLSDDEGRFAFAHAAPGTRRVGARKSGFASAYVTVDVPAGQDLQDVTVALARARSVRGIVKDERGEPLAGVSVAAHSHHDYLGRSGRTDAEGAFEVGDLPAGPLTIEAYAKGLVRAEVPVGADAGEVSVTMRRAGQLAGRVIDAASGAPIGLFTVRFVSPTDRTLTPLMSGYSASWVRPGKTFDSADGTWSSGEFDELAPGAWTGVEVSAPGYAPRLLERVAVSAPDDGTLLVHALVPPVRVELTVVDARTGQPVVGAALLAATTERFGEEDPRWTARTDGAGLAALTDVAPGSLFVRVARTGRVPLVRGPFEVPEGARRAVIAVEVPGGATVDVALADEAGAPLAGRTVHLTAQRVEGLGDGQRVSLVSDAEGRVRFEDVLPGRWQVARAMRDGEHESHDLWRTVEVPADLAGVRCELRPPGKAVLRGRVESALALPEELVVSVIARDAGTSLAAFVRGGAFEVRGLAAGSYLVTTGFWDRVESRTAMGHAELVVDPGERDVEVTLAMKPGR